MYKFDTKVQELKYRVLKEVAKLAYEDKLVEKMNEIPKIIVPGPKPTMRCCIYKERAIAADRVALAVKKPKESENVIHVISIACEDCPLGGYFVGDACRGCIAHRCETVCFKKAIYFDEVTRHAHIDKTKCVNCGLCAKNCPYNAITNRVRPCEAACPVKAISPDINGAAVINDDKCVQCGKCVYMCPFGAINDESYITEVIKYFKESENNTKYKVYAIVAPSISSQFYYAKLGQVISGLKLLGFHTVVEAALGADMVAYKEAKELEEKGILTSSCCPAFVSYIKKMYPSLVDNISSNLSPMAEISRYVKSVDPTSKVVFIGPCTAKKQEIKDEKVGEYVDATLTFEEVQALFDAKDLDISSLKLDLLDNASYFGRIFARTGGLSDSVVEALKEQGSDFEVKPVVCSGIDECKLALNKFKAGKLDGNFIEGMACNGGCIGGPCCLTHEVRDKSEVDKYGHEALEKTIESAISAVEDIDKK
ncbi:MAG: 4Fe-4S dicluster domain-containing protein [Bacilli bacterium]